MTVTQAAPVSHADPEGVEAAIRAIWPADSADKAVRVAWCESNDKPAVRNGQFYGLFQVGVRVHAERISRLGYTTADMLTPEPNIRVALDLYAEQGWTPWSCKHA